MSANSNDESMYNPYSNILKVTSRRSKPPAIAPSSNFFPDDIEPVLTELNEIACKFDEIRTCV